MAPTTYEVSKPEPNQSPKKGKMTKFAKEAVSEQSAQPEAEGQMKQQAQQTSAAASTSRIDQETSRLSPRN